ncbi:hypothetical protein [Sphingomonas profundi]|uniref:hypothetical protein n=1 Tax=Alterirhizorhabdus profundi TaxID=2681549 RepID=UPI0012E8A5C6|nr:hypothetical protein [Sphingomonas profundi]
MNERLGEIKKSQARPHGLLDLVGCAGNLLGFREGSDQQVIHVPATPFYQTASGWRSSVAYSRRQHISANCFRQSHPPKPLRQYDGVPVAARRSVR